MNKAHYESVQMILVGYEDESGEHLSPQEYLVRLKYTRKKNRRPHVSVEVEDWFGNIYTGSEVDRLFDRIPDELLCEAIKNFRDVPRNANQPQLV